MQRNRHAAQFCKTEEYRSAQRARMIEYDKLHPERREKISEFDKRTWDLCPEIKEAMTQFAMSEAAYVRAIVMKNFEEFLSLNRKNVLKKVFIKDFGPLILI